MQAKCIDNIHITLTARENDVLKDGLRSSEYLLRNKVVGENIAYINKNCELPASSDKAFHTVATANITEGVELMRSFNKIQA